MYGEVRRYPRANVVAREVRLQVARQLGKWGLDRLYEPVALVANELVANAVVHGTGAGLAVGLESDGATVCISVRDANPVRPEKREARDGENGRGLVLVNAVAWEWGSYSVASGGGKVVWAIVGEEEWERS